MSKCGACHTPLDHPAYCPKCSQIQPHVVHNVFELLMLPLAFPVDTGTLQKNYFALQRVLHPDKLLHLSPKDRAAAAKWSEDLNRSYQCLQETVQSLEAYIRIKDGVLDSAFQSREILEEGFQFQEKLLDENTREATLKEIVILYDQVLQGVQKALEENKLDDVKQAYFRLNQFDKMRARYV